MRCWMPLLAVTLAAGAPLGAQTDPMALYHAEGARAGKPNATIAYGIAPFEVGDLRLPTGPGPFPVAMVIHGGCWRAAMDSRFGTAAVAEALTRRGFATWNVEYARVGDSAGGWPGTFRDIAAAEDKLAELAKAYPLDLRRVTIVGHSSGAHLALWAASRPRLAPPWSAAKVRPKSVVAIDGPAALAPFIGIDSEACGSPAIVPLMGGAPSERPAEYKAASPADHLPLGVRQLLVGAYFAPLMRPYAAVAKARGDSVELFEPPGANHADIVTPSTPNGAAVIDFIVKKAF